MLTLTEVENLGVLLRNPLEIAFIIPVEWE